MNLVEPLRLFEVLSDFGVPFVIIGGHAVAYHGYIRTTEDADIVFARSPEAEEKLYRALESVQAYWIGNEVDPKSNLEITHPITKAYIQNTHLMMLGTDFGYLDVFDYIPGFPDVSVDQLFKDGVDDGRYIFVSLPWLLDIKRKSGRSRDLADIEELEKL